MLLSSRSRARLDYPRLHHSPGKPSGGTSLELHVLLLLRRGRRCGRRCSRMHGLRCSLLLLRVGLQAAGLRPGLHAKLLLQCW